MIANTGLEVIFSAMLSAFSAQMLKAVFFLAKNRSWNFKILTETGGMPSSHSAFVIALSTSVAAVNGYRSVEFAIALGFAFVVMYDAAGLRRSAGKMAAVLNRVVDDIYTHRKGHAQERLIELLGHTPLEVFMGALLGCVIALGYHALLIG